MICRVPCFVMRPNAYLCRGQAEHGTIVYTSSDSYLLGRNHFAIQLCAIYRCQATIIILQEAPFSPCNTRFSPTSSEKRSNSSTPVASNAAQEESTNIKRSKVEDSIGARSVVRRAVSPSIREKGVRSWLRCKKNTTKESYEERLVLCHEHGARGKTELLVVLVSCIRLQE